MKYIVATTALLFALSAYAQTQPTQPALQPQVLPDHHAIFDAADSDETESLKLDIQENADGQIHLVVRDKATDRILSDSVITQDERKDNIAEQDVESLQAAVPGEELASLRQTRHGYVMSLGINRDQTTMTITEEKTKQVVCSTVDNGQKTQVFGPDQKLIAEGASEEDDPTRIYNKSAYKKCEKVINIFNDDD